MVTIEALTPQVCQDCIDLQEDCSMKQHDCTDAIGQVPRLPVEPPTLGQLWLLWLARRLRRLPDLLLVCLDRSRQRRRLGEMDDRMLRDIGLSRTSAWAEMQKWFWQP
jgi:uncharacterized protein YjiS (DUF1127 family)